MSNTDDANFTAQAVARHYKDQYDADMVERLRQLGRDTGQPKTYERRAQQYLTEQGY